MPTQIKIRLMIACLALALLPMAEAAKAADRAPADAELETVRPAPAPPAQRFERIEDWFRGLYAKFTGGCNVSDDQISLADIKCLEARRRSLNTRRGVNAGDRELIYRMLIFARDRDSSSKAEAILTAWSSSSPDLSSIETWGDQKYLYRYLAHLKIQETAQFKSSNPSIVVPRKLISPEEFATSIVSIEAAAPAAAPPPPAGEKDSTSTPADFFTEKSRLTLKSKTRLGANVTLNSVMDDGRDVGFLIENSGATTEFLFDANGLDLKALASSKKDGRGVIAELPAPMHTDGARLIELGAVNGQIFNLLTGGGTRRSGLVVLTPDGRAFPFHVEDIDPAVWGSPSKNHLNLLNSTHDFVTFLQIVKQEKLSVFMEMLLGEEMNGQLGLTPIKNLALARSARLLVWKSQADGKPSILFLNKYYGKNRAVWAAHRLGYKWMINLDAYYIDGARYFAPTDSGREAKMFGTPFEHFADKPWSRIVFRDLPSK